MVKAKKNELHVHVGYENEHSCYLGHSLLYYTLKQTSLRRFEGSGLPYYYYKARLMYDLRIIRKHEKMEAYIYLGKTW